MNVVGESNPLLVYLGRILTIVDYDFFVRKIQSKDVILKEWQTDNWQVVIWCRCLFRSAGITPAPWLQFFCIDVVKVKPVDIQMFYQKFLCFINFSA